MYEWCVCMCVFIFCMFVVCMFVCLYECMDCGVEGLGVDCYLKICRVSSGAVFKGHMSGDGLASVILLVGVNVFGVTQWLWFSVPLGWVPSVMTGTGILVVADTSWD